MSVSLKTVCITLERAMDITLQTAKGDKILRSLSYITEDPVSVLQNDREPLANI